jgi:tripartite-type tricarboxylate transporter receptor subunit TctC
MEWKKRSKLFGGVICLLLVYFIVQSPRASFAEEAYPTRPIKLIVPFAAGGPTDVACRKLADLAAKDLGQEIIVENKVGAGGTVGSRFVAKSKPDGYTIGSLGSSTVVIAPTFRKLDFHPVKDFTTIVQYGIGDHPLAVRADSPIKTFKDFVSEARKRQVTYASMELIAADMAMKRLAIVAKLNLKLLPYPGAAPSIAACIGGHAEAVVCSGMYEYVRAGKLRLLAQTGGVRNKEFSDIPTFKELGYDVEAVVFYGLVAPKGLPEHMRKKLEEVFTKAVHDPSFAQTMQNASYTVFYRNGKDFAKYLDEVYVKSEEELKAMGMGKYAKDKK